MKKVISISGKRWFQKTYGNTYHSFTILFDDGEIYHSGVHYGYGEQYLYNALKYLQGFGYPYKYGSELSDAEILYYVEDVKRKKDL